MNCSINPVKMGRASHCMLLYEIFTKRRAGELGSDEVRKEMGVFFSLGTS